MQQRGDETHLETDEARGGTTKHGVRWVLAISLIAAIVLLTLTWVSGTTVNDADEAAGAVSAEQSASGVNPAN
jgi:hypothetical protein